MEDITVKELKERMDKGEKLTIIDVRQEYEFDEFNIGGKLIPLDTLPEAMQDLGNLKDKEIIIHCKAGGRSATAKAYLMQNGFTKVRNLLGGVMDWKAEFGSEPISGIK
jgi:rhodanese-related sulfurtransferase